MGRTKRVGIDGKRRQALVHTQLRFHCGGLLLLALTACDAEIDHLFNEDGSLTHQIAVGDEIDDEEGELISCDGEPGTEEGGFVLEYVQREERGAQKLKPTTSVFP